MKLLNEGLRPIRIYEMRSSSKRDLPVGQPKIWLFASALNRSWSLELNFVIVSSDEQCKSETVSQSDWQSTLVLKCLVHKQ